MKILLQKIAASDFPLSQLKSLVGFFNRIPAAAWFIFTIVNLAVLFHTVDLKPKVERNFFFSTEDEQFLEDRKIVDLFPEPEQIIISAKGDLRSKRYIDKLEALSSQLEDLPYVMGVQSMVRGPLSIKDAFKSVLWKRVLISEDERSSNLLAFIAEVSAEEFVPEIEKIVEEFESPDFDLMISGPPYIVEMIRRYLLEDLKRFSLAALAIFGTFILIIFRSFRVLIGAVIACINATAIALLVAHWCDIEIGPLTANLSTIVFVLSLGHIVFITFNLRNLVGESKGHHSQYLVKAVRMTLTPSFWSMLTTFLGFGTLIFVQATPLQKLGISGSLGSLIAFLVTYCIYPAFLRHEIPILQKGKRQLQAERKISAVFLNKHIIFVSVICVGVGVLSTGIGTINMDPSMLSYFKPGGELRKGLDYIDENGGSSPLKFVISNGKDKKFNTNKAYNRLWDLQKSLESHAAVGSVVSLPLIVWEGRKRVPLASMLPWNFVLRLLGSSDFTDIARYFVTDDWKRTLIFLRMKESEREFTRTATINQLKGIVWAKGFNVDLVGGVYLLQGRLARLVNSSLLWGLFFLVSLFVIMGFFLSVSLRITLALFISISLIPLWLLGWVAYLKIPLDIISAPATNLAVAMGVDAMIHLLVFTRRFCKRSMCEWEAWMKALSQLWKPIMSAMIIVCAGFGIFGVSHFPPTERFGMLVIFGTIMSPLAALFVLPALAGYPEKWFGFLSKFKK